MSHRSLSSAGYLRQATAVHTTRVEIFALFYFIILYYSTLVEPPRVYLRLEYATAFTTSDLAVPLSVAAMAALDRHCYLCSV